MEVPSRSVLTASCLNVLRDHGAICGEIIGMSQEEFPSGLSNHVRVLAKCLSMVWLECFEPGRVLLPLGAGQVLPE